MKENKVANLNTHTNENLADKNRGCVIEISADIYRSIFLGLQYQPIFIDRVSTALIVSIVLNQI